MDGHEYVTERTGDLVKLLEGPNSAKTHFAPDTAQQRQWMKRESGQLGIHRTTAA